MFGAGTVFWSWGLSDQHDSSPYGANIETTALQQFTINMFADMGIQPQVADAFLASQGLVRASATNDHIAPAALFLASDLCGDKTGHVLATSGSRMYAFKLVETEGKFKDEGAIWTAKEIADHWEAITKS